MGICADIFQSFSFDFFIFLFSLSALFVAFAVNDPSGGGDGGGNNDGSGIGNNNDPSGDGSGGDAGLREDIAAIKEQNPEMFQKLADYFIGKGKSEAQKQAEKKMQQLQEERKKLLADLKKIREQFTGTQQEKEQLEAKIRELEEQVLSKEELAKKRFEEERRKQQEQLQKLQSEAERWRTSFENHLIETKILEAASRENTRAFNPRQIVALLRQNAFVEPEVDESGNETGRFKVKLKLPDPETGQPQEYDFDEGWEKWANLPENDNLFASRLVPGTDLGLPADKLTGDIPAAALKDPELYKKYREKILSQKLGG